MSATCRTLDGVSDDDYGGPRRPTFSQAHGYTEYATEIQLEALDERLRTDIWNYILVNYLDRRTANPIPLQGVWADYLGLPINQYEYSSLSGQFEMAVSAGPWYGVYDLIQWLVQRTPPGYGKFGSPSDDFNRILARNRAGYRIVEQHVVPITDSAELAAITSAVVTASTPAGNHIKNALALFADRDNPNYAKSIQESISAAESAAQELARVAKPLGEALDAVPAL